MSSAVRVGSMVLVLAAGVDGVAQDRSPVVINEVHYDPVDKTERGEFIELFNSASEAMDLGGWALTKGVRFAIPAETSVPANGFLVVAEDPKTIEQRYGIAALGPWEGKLKNGGERIVLVDGSGAKVDEIDYKLGFPWPLIDGDLDSGSQSIELVHPALDNAVGGSWRPSGDAPTATPPVYLVPPGATWRYFKGVRAPSRDAAAWRSIGFSDRNWDEGAAPIGYGESFLRESLSDMNGRYSTVYFRCVFSVDDPDAIEVLKLSVLYDDGANVWLNGQHVFSGNVQAKELTHHATTFKRSDVHDFASIDLSGARGLLTRGENVLAAHVVNTSRTGSSDFYFDAALIGIITVAGAHHGPTPGKQNRKFAANIGPQMRKVTISPVAPVSGDAVSLSIKATDPDGVASVTLEYQPVDPGRYFSRYLPARSRSMPPVPDPRFSDPDAWLRVPMAMTADDIYSATIPASVQTHRRLVRYRFRATDTHGETRLAPNAEDPQPNFAYFVYDGVPAWRGSIQPRRERRGAVVTFPPEALTTVPVYHFLADARDVQESQFGGYTGSDYPWTGTLVYDGKVYDHIGFRPRGGIHRFRRGKNFWKFNFHRGRRFQAKDNYGREYPEKWDKLNLSSAMQNAHRENFRGEFGLFESASFRLFQLAGVHASDTHFVHFRVVDTAQEQDPRSQYVGDFNGLYVAVEQVDSRFLQANDLPDGNLYKIETYTGFKKNQGATHPRDDADIRQFQVGFRANPGADWWRRNFNLAKYFSYRSIVESVHHYDIAQGKNYYYYHNGETGRWEIVPWDVDLTWSDGHYGTGDHRFQYLIAQNAAFRQDYWNRQREILDLLFNREQTGMLIDELARFIHREGGAPSISLADYYLWEFNPANRYPGSSFQFTRAVRNKPNVSGIVDHMKGYIDHRRRWIQRSILRDAVHIPRTPTITYTGAKGFPADRLRFQIGPFLAPRGSRFAAFEWRLGATTNPHAPGFDPAVPRHYEITPVWQSGEISKYSKAVAVPADGNLQPGQTYRARVRMKDTAGRWSHWSSPVEFVAGSPRGER